MWKLRVEESLHNTQYTMSCQIFKESFGHYLPCVLYTIFSVGEIFEHITLEILMRFAANANYKNILQPHQPWVAFRHSFTLQSPAVSNSWSLHGITSLFVYELLVGPLVFWTPFGRSDLGKLPTPIYPWKMLSITLVRCSFHLVWYIISKSYVVAYVKSKMGIFFLWPYERFTTFTLVLNYISKENYAIKSRVEDDYFIIKDWCSAPLKWECYVTTNEGVDDIFFWIMWTYSLNLLSLLYLYKAFGVSYQSL